MRAMSSNPYALHPPPVLPSTRIEYGGEGALYASQRSGVGWHVTPATKLCPSFLTIHNRVLLVHACAAMSQPSEARLHTKLRHVWSVDRALRTRGLRRHPLVGHWLR